MSTNPSEWISYRDAGITNGRSNIKRLKSFSFDSGNTKLLICFRKVGKLLLKSHIHRTFCESPGKMLTVKKQKQFFFIKRHEFQQGFFLRIWKHTERGRDLQFSVYSPGSCNQTEVQSQDLPQQPQHLNHLSLLLPGH